jgi:hypothetical protein
MSVQELKEAITKLEPEELSELERWIADYKFALWDAQLEEDVRAGRLDQIAEEAEREYQAGLVKPLREKQ